MSRAKGFVIYKSTRLPHSESYAGPTWDAESGLRNNYKPVYSTKREAQKWAKKLSLLNPVGFSVSRAPFGF